MIERLGDGNHMPFLQNKNLKIILNFLIVSVFLAVIQGCELNSPIGLNFVQEEPLQLLYVDTVHMEFSTVQFDSIRTDNLKRILLGHACDTYLGDISSYPYFTITTDSIDEMPDHDLVEYDRLVFDLSYDGYWYYDTTQEFTFYVYPVQEEIKPLEDGYLYNTSSFLYVTDSVQLENFIGRFSFYPRPHDEHIEFELSDETGIGLYNYLKEEGIPGTRDFSERYPGFVIVPDDNNQCFLGFSDQSKIILYYENQGIEGSETFWISDGTYFNHIQTDRSKSLLADLNEQVSDISSDQTTDLAFIQGGAGLALKISMPNLEYLRELNESLYITEALLDIYPEKNSFNGSTFLTPQVSIFIINGNNRVIETTDYENFMVIDDEFQEDTFYEMNITSFLKDQINNLEYNGESLLITFGDENYQLGVNRMIIDNREFKSKLKLLILSVHE